MKARCAALMVGALSGAALAVDTESERSNITYPPEGSRFNIKDTVVLSWTSNYTENHAQINVWTQTGSNYWGPVWTQNISGTENLPDGSYAIDLDTINFDTTYSQGGTWNNFFNIWQNSSAEHDSGGLPYIRQDFVIYQDANKPAQTWSAQPVPTTSLSPSATSGGQRASPTPAHDCGLSTGAKVGIGVGVALGVLALVAIVGGIFYVRRKKARRNRQPVTEQSPGSTPAWTQPKPSPMSQSYYSPAPAYPSGQFGGGPQYQYHPYEMAGSQPHNEMPAGNDGPVLHEMAAPPTQQTQYPRL